MTEATDCSLPLPHRDIAKPTPVPALAYPLGAQAPTTLAQLTTTRIGGPIASYLEAHSEQEMIEAIKQADAAGTPLLVVGGGSNLLASDAGFDGLVLRDARSEISVNSDTQCGGVEFTVTAGMSLDELVCEAIANEWAGFAPLSGIPGTVGAAPVQNVGAYGTEIAELVTAVRAWDRLKGRVVYLALTDLKLAYRDSLLKQSLRSVEAGGGRLWGPTGRWVVLSVTFQVRQAYMSHPIAYKQLASHLGVELGDRVDNTLLRQAVLELRRSKGMVLDPADHNTWSSGSFFTNPVLTQEQADKLPSQAPRFEVTDHSMIVGTRPAPVVPGLVKTSAAWLIQHAGFGPGFALDDAAPASLSTVHVLAITNRGNASAADIEALAKTVIAGVRDKYGLTLVPEPVRVGLDF